MQAANRRTHTASRFEAFYLIGIVQMWTEVITKETIIHLKSIWRQNWRFFLGICTVVWQRGLLIAAELFTWISFLRRVVYARKRHRNDFQAVRSRSAPSLSTIPEQHCCVIIENVSSHWETIDWGIYLGKGQPDVVTQSWFSNNCDKNEQPHECNQRNPAYCFQGSMSARNSTRLHFANSFPDPDHGGNIPRKLHGVLGRVPPSKTPHRHQLLHCVIGRVRPIDFRVDRALPNPPNITQWRLLP